MYTTPVLCRTIYSTALTAETPIVLLPAKPGTRYLIHGVTIALRNTVGEACVGQSMYSYVGGEQCIIAYAMINPSAVNHSEVHVNGQNLLLDQDKAVYTYASGAVPASSACTVIYSEVHI